MAPGGVDAYESDDLYDDYDADDYGEENAELSPEDKAQMEKGTDEVKRLLGTDVSKVTVAQIQETLWHYYWDVDKSVSYLRSQIKPAAPKSTPKKAPEGMSSSISFSADHCLRAEVIEDLVDPGLGFASVEEKVNLFTFSSLRYATVSSPRFDFDDMPWLSVPVERMSSFETPLGPPGGLLGGGEGPPKMSKLQALAASRKKKTDEKRGQEQTLEAEKGIKALSISEDSKKENLPPQSLAKRQKTIRAAEAQPSPEPSRPSSQNLHTLKSDTLSPILASPGHGAISNQPHEDAVEVVQKRGPSAFAQSLFGPGDRVPARRSTFSMPYTNSPDFRASAFAKPSPDDVVLAAQSQAGKKTPAAVKPAKKIAAEKANGKEPDLSDSVSKLKVNDIPHSKSKGIDVVKEFESNPGKRFASFVVVGHVDAGKSTLMGRLLVSLKYVEERTVEKFRKLAESSGKQSFALAWVMDQRSEERERGVTIDIATNYFETDRTKFTILDAPGHQDFVPNMIAGASQADFAILVIDANTGAYEKGLKGQTREHVLLLRSLGVQRLVVAVNKLDMVNWSRARFEEITQQITGFLTGLGFHSKAVGFIPISGLNGDNITEKIKEPAASWFTGDTLIEALEASVPSPSKAMRKPFRMSISEVFRSQQGTTTLGGRVDSGTVQIGDVVFVQPSGETAHVKSIMVDKDNQEWAVAGQNITLALTDIDPIHIRVGDIVCLTTDPITCGDSFTMKAMAFEHLMPMPVDIHRGRLHAPGQLIAISATLNKATGEVIKKKPKIVQPGDVARVTVKLANKVPLEAGQRLVVRSGGETIAAGLIE